MGGCAASWDLAEGLEQELRLRLMPASPSRHQQIWPLMAEEETWGLRAVGLSLAVASGGHFSCRLPLFFFPDFHTYGL